MVFRLRLFIQQSEQETVRKHSGHKIYSARNFLKLMSDAKKKIQQTWLIQKGSVSFNSDLLRRGLLRTGFRGSDKIRNRAIFGRLRGSFTATKLKSVTMLLRDFVCLCNNTEWSERFEGNRRAEFKMPAEYWQAGSTRFAYIPPFKSSIDFSCWICNWKDTKRSICEKKLVS